MNKSHISVFIEDAIEGGWFPIQDTWREEHGYFVSDGYTRLNIKTKAGLVISLSERDILLDPLAWKAVAKTKKWKRPIDPETNEELLVDPSDNFAQEMWEDNWHKFIDHLADGKDIEEALKAITPNT